VPKSRKWSTDFVNIDGCDSRAEQWYALRVKSRHEQVVSTSARNRGFEEFLPVYQARHRWSDRVKTIDVPLFPGYVFCRLRVENRLPLLTIPGVLHMVGIGKSPVAIVEGEIHSIQEAVASKLWAEPYPFLEVGERVRLQAGPLEGLEGILVEVRKHYRVVVSITMLRRSIAVEIERDWVVPVENRGGPGVLAARTGSPFVPVLS
jgi:transcription termination/antitermination protein NusG